MSVVRVAILLAVVVGLTLFALQNVSPAVSLVFLGMRSKTLPFSVWVLLSVAAGVLTSFLISAFMRLSNYFTEQASRPRPRSGTYTEGRGIPNQPPPRKPDLNPPSVTTWPTQEAETRTMPRTDYVSEPRYNVSTVLQPDSVIPPPEPPQTVASPELDKLDEEDWVEGTIPSASETNDEEWDDEDEWPAETQAPPLREYETKQEPKTQFWAGSVYSFGYREPQNTGVGKTESVYDADYRVIQPPSPPATPDADDWETPSSQSGDDDWGLDEDEVAKR